MVEVRATGQPAGPRASVRRVPTWLIGPLLFVCVLAGYTLSFNVDKPTHNADWYIRYQVACAVVEHNTFAIHPYRQDDRTGPGVHGLDYAQYTLGQTTALIPLYLLGRVLAGVPHTDCGALIAPPIVFLTAKMLNLILGALLCALCYAAARALRYSPLQSVALALLLAFGTSLWPDVLSGEEHTMESLFLLAAAYAALRYTLQRRHSRLWVAAMGVAAGLVFVTRVAGVIAPPIFVLYLLVLHRRWQPRGWSFMRPFLRDAAIFALGVLPSIAINAVYDVLRFGSPLRTGPYPDQSLGYPPYLGLPNLLVSPGKGLVWYTPAVFLLLLAARPFWRRLPLPAALFGLICGVYILFYSTVNYWHGDPAWGPRYLYAILPYAILPLGELFKRWRGYRLPLRGLVVGVLAATFLVQFATASVSYWRHWHYIYGYHYDQVENHAWGQNLNYWWAPEQSPIVITLEGIADITQKYIDHAPLLSHVPQQRLSDPLEPCTFNVYGQAYICITDLDELRYGFNWNTFSMWWVHTYPWWGKRTVMALALGVFAIFLVSGAALLLLVTRFERRKRAGPGVRGGTVLIPNGRGGNGHDGDTPLNLAGLIELDARAPVPTSSHGQGAVLVEAPPAPSVAQRAAAPSPRPVGGLRPLATAAVLAGVAYGSIAGVAAAHAPHRTPALIRTVPMSTTVHDGNLAYRVLGVTSLTALPAGIAVPPPYHHYVIVKLRLENHTARPYHVRIDFFALTDTGGLGYPRSASNDPKSVMVQLNQIAELYHLTRVGTAIPAHGVVDGVLLYVVRDSSHNLELLGPGITLVRLNQ